MGHVEWRVAGEASWGHTARRPGGVRARLPLAHCQPHTLGRGHRVAGRARSRRTSPRLGQRLVAESRRPSARWRSRRRTTGGCRWKGRRTRLPEAPATLLGYWPRQSEAAARAMGHVARRDGRWGIREGHGRRCRAPYLARPTPRMPPAPGARAWSSCGAACAPWPIALGTMVACQAVTTAAVSIRLVTGIPSRKSWRYSAKRGCVVIVGTENETVRLILVETDSKQVPQYLSVVKRPAELTDRLAPSVIEYANPILPIGSTDESDGGHIRIL